MKLYKLADFSKSISKTVGTAFIAIFFIALGIFGLIYAKSYKNELVLQTKQLVSANQLLQSNLSGKLSIIANSNIFLDYLRSGSISRQNMAADFESEILPLKSSAMIIGMRIASTGDNNLIYKSGKNAKEQVSLKLCYLNTRLNQYGPCRYTWTIYLSKREYIKALNRIDRAIETCTQKSCKPFNLLRNKKFGTFQTTDKSMLKFAINLKTNKDINIYIFSIFILLALLILFSFLIRNNFDKIVMKNLIRPLNLLVNSLEGNKKNNPNKYDIEEINKLAKQINTWKDKFTEYKQHEKELAIGKLSAQVAHDIRSPLASLNTAILHTKELPENQRAMIRSATQRINDIANNLLSQYKETGKSETLQNEVTQNYLLYTLLDSIISEKRQSLSQGLKINFTTQKKAHMCCAKIHRIEFARVISNIINNSIEAITDSGKINVSLKQKGNYIFIAIEDSGYGIPEKLLSSIYNKGISYRKKDGTGIGLYHAKQHIESWQGNITITSKENKGTNVLISLPKAKPPRWLERRLIFPENAVIVILDDDESIHHIWDQRLKNLKNIVHFKKSNGFLKWMLKNKNLDNHFFLFDHELINGTRSGLDIIEKYNLTKKATLVTSRYDEIDILDRCLKNNISLLPKSLSAYIPIIFLNTPPDYIVIEDNKTLRDAWELDAIHANKILYCFESPKEFERVIEFIPKNTIIYIDSDLGNNIKGEKVAKTYFESGFTEIYITTGYDKDKFNDCLWVKGVIGKESPFKK
jgi:signal transduction histidine kinase